MKDIYLVLLMIYYIFTYLLIFSNTCFNFKFAGMQKHFSKNNFKNENKIK